MSANDHLIVEIVGSAAAVCSTASFLPQLIKLTRERSAEDVSLRMYLLTVAAFALWAAYGAMLGSWPLVVSNLVSLGLSGAILALKLAYRRSAARASAAAPPPGRPPPPAAERPAAAVPPPAPVHAAPRPAPR
jgi:MtN3 and saliva related transmembrane protein